MTLTFCWDQAAADWIVHSDLPWQQLVGFGPAELASGDDAVYIDDEKRGAQRADAQPGVAPEPAASPTTPRS